jgi:hypothetical protein
VILSEQTRVVEEAEQPVLAVVLAPQPPPQAIEQPDLLAAEHVRAIPVVIVVGLADRPDAPSDRCIVSLRERS